MKASLRLLVFLGVLRFLIDGANDHHENEGVAGNLKQDFVEVVNMGIRGKHRVLSKLFELNYMSKRKVPNGPDPIHNRSVVSFFSFFIY